MRKRGIVVIGAGVGGLTAAAMLAAQGASVTILERMTTPGGKMRQVSVAGALLDAGPTVFTMRWVFDAIFAAAGTSLDQHIQLRRATILARHAWSATERLDLFADIDESTDAIGQFAGAVEARGYRAFCDQARRIYQTLEQPFIRAPLPTPLSLVLAAGLRGLPGLLKISPFESMWHALSKHFQDARLRQLFGRYATYCGSSPFMAPATLMLVAHVEQDGVWLVEGGMHRIAIALADLASAGGATFRYGSDVAEITVKSGRTTGVTLRDGEWIEADAVIVNGDVSAVAGGQFGQTAAAASRRIPAAGRSLSALTWAIAKPTKGFPLQRHNVFFSRDSAAEFDDLFKHKRLPIAPTVYVCAQDRDQSGALKNDGERLLCLVNAPATGDTRPLTPTEIAQCTERSFSLLARCGLTLDPNHALITTPTEFEAMFPATGGGLYGQAVHGPMASFRRPGARSKVPGLYLAGGSTHPGAGVPMAALSGQIAAATVLSDFASTGPSRVTATPGGMLTR